MTTKTLIIKQLSRLPKTGNFDELNFEPGVNVLVGQPNTGKTQWLRMFNFLMGDRDSNPANAFDESLVNKYDSVKGIFVAGDEEIILERNWKQSGNKGKVFINGEPITTDNFSAYLLSLLEIPTVHYPQGNPLSLRTWPELSWQSLLRHIYRRQTS
jgi:DNA repair ATPase RecN